MVPPFSEGPLPDLDCLLRAPVDAGITLGAGTAPGDSSIGYGDVLCRADPGADPAPVAAIGRMEPPGSAVHRCYEEAEERSHNPVRC